MIFLRYIETQTYFFRNFALEIHEIDLSLSLNPLVDLLQL